MVLVAAVTISLVLAFPSARGWEPTSGGQAETAGWDATTRADGDGASIRLRGGLFDRSTVDLPAPGPGNSVRPTVQELNEGAFVTGLAAQHVAAVRLLRGDAVLGEVEPVQGGVFILPVGSDDTSALTVEGVDADGQTLGTWTPLDQPDQR